MQCNYIKFNPLKSIERIDKIINESGNAYEELEEIPSRDKLTYNNGYYVNCSAIFVDIRSSSKLTDVHYRPKLAKLYRTYISEVVAIINGNINCKEINVVGDCVSGIFDASSKKDIISAYCTALQISSIIAQMNDKFKNNDIEEIKVGIGLSQGKALMIKAGYNGSGINDVVWMGDVVNEASKLCNYANKTQPYYEIMISESVYEKLYPVTESKFVFNSDLNCYQGNPYCSTITHCLNCEKLKYCDDVIRCDLYYTITSE